MCNKAKGKLNTQGEAEISNTPLGQAKIYFGYSEDEVKLPSIDDFEYEYSESALREQLNEYLEIEDEEFAVEDVIDMFINLTAYFI